jgi:hypothetical protein
MSVQSDAALSGMSSGHGEGVAATTEGAVRADDIVTSIFDVLDGAAGAFRASTDPQEWKVLVRL